MFKYKYKWQSQFFKKYNEISKIPIPISDEDGYILNPKHNWVYNKYLLTKSCGEKVVGLHGIQPKKNYYPLFSKPIYNLTGMGSGIQVINNEEEMRQKYQPGHFWMKLYNGEHLSTDLVVDNGKILWLAHTKGFPLEDGTFDYWEIIQNKRYKTTKTIEEWIKNNLPNYKGIINIETINNKIIECHLRFTSQWVDLNGDNWIQNLIDFYQNNKKNNLFKEKSYGYSVVLFMKNYPKKEPEKKLINEIKLKYNIQSIQITYDENKVRNKSSMPPGGVRVAIINSKNLENGKKARNEVFNLLKKL